MLSEHVSDAVSVSTSAACQPCKCRLHPWPGISHNPLKIVRTCSYGYKGATPILLFPPSNNQIDRKLRQRICLAQTLLLLACQKDV